MSTVKAGWAVVPPAALICWFSARICNRRTFDSSVFSEINFVSVVARASAFTLAAFLAVLKLPMSDEVHTTEVQIIQKVCNGCNGVISSAFARSFKISKWSQSSGVGNVLMKASILLRESSVLMMFLASSSVPLASSMVVFRVLCFSTALANCSCRDPVEPDTF